MHCQSTQPNNRVSFLLQQVPCSRLADRLVSYPIHALSLEKNNPMQSVGDEKSLDQRTISTSSSNFWCTFADAQSTDAVDSIDDFSMTFDGINGLIEFLQIPRGEIDWSSASRASDDLTKLACNHRSCPSLNVVSVEREKRRMFHI